ncbi:glycosyltransferase [Bacillus sp. FJAT-27225]|uniref:glycosyltransferase n=1 Tax=Bacillus sp. FJAT-27225 TaxID=1743144 RepID=UPI0034A0C2DC
MIEKYESADIIVNSSLSEGQPLALMEAMGLGLPVIGRKNNANLQLISHEKTGWLYETIPDFIEAVHSIVSNTTLRENIVKQAKESMFEKFLPEKEAMAYLSLYHQIGR